MAVETVLLIEDDVLVRMPVSQYLRECGYRVLEAATTDEAKLILQQRDIQVDAVLTDIEIPGSMNGFGFAEWAVSVRPGLEVILAGTPERATRAAADLCEERPIAKPYDHKVVLDRIKRLLAARARRGGKM